MALQNPPVGHGAIAAATLMEALSYTTTDIADSFLIEPRMNRDERGFVGELLRCDWVAPLEFVQWNLVSSSGRTLRGMHWHALHHDLIAPVAGRILVGLSDLRAGSPTEGRAMLVGLPDACRAQTHDTPELTRPRDLG